MNLKNFKKCVDKCYEHAREKAENVDVEIWYKKKSYKVQKIGQFKAVPTVTIIIGEKVFDFTEESL